MASTYNVKKARELAGMSQKDLAEALNIAQQSVYYYESGARDIKASMLLKIANVTGVTVSYLLGTTNDPHGEAPAAPDSDPDFDRLVRNYRAMGTTERTALLAASDALAASAKHSGNVSGGGSVHDSAPEGR